MFTPIHLYLPKADITVRFKKLNNHEWFEFQKAYAPIFEDWNFLMELDYYHYSDLDFNLPKIYTALFTLFGPHNGYDDFKCSFSYRLELQVTRKKKQYTYGLAMMDMKGNMPYFTYYRKPIGKEEANVYQQPIDKEFSKDDMRVCTLGLIIFLKNFFDAYQPFFNQNFYRINAAGYLIYGFQKGEFFNNYYPRDTEDAYEKFQKKIETFSKKRLMKTPMSQDFWTDEETAVYVK